MEYAQLPAQDDQILSGAKTNRSVMQIIALTPGSSNTWDSAVIPSGKRLVIRRFGFTDDGSSDNKAATFRLRWGVTGSFQDVRLGAVSAGTEELAVNKLFVGDGANLFRVVSTNASALNARNVAFWIEAYDY